MTRLTPLLALALLAGCRPADDQVSSYDAPKTRVPAAAPATPAPAETAKLPPVDQPAPGAPVRTLAVIVPGVDKYSRFVKLKADADRVDAVEPQFLAFVKSIASPTTPDGPLAYSTPDGWRKSPGRQFVEAAFQAGAPGKVVEVTVSNPIGGVVLDNVNRWRKEVGLEEIGAERLAESSKSLEGGPKGAILVDLRGTAQAGGSMRGPFQK